ncbi:MAG: alpha-L-fucosidase, partial [Rhodothermales bacterium]
PDAQAPHWPTYNTKKKSNPNFQRYIDTYLKPQVRELVVKYDPVVLWFDADWIPEYTHAMGLDLYEFVRGLKPEILINNRVDTGRKGKQGMNADDRRYAGDFGTPEQQILEGTSSFDWETCMTMNDSWGYNANDHNWKPAETLIHQLIDVVSKGGNYLLNVGPTAEGVFPGPSVERLGEMGDWLAINGEAIYGSRPWTTSGEGDSIRYTSMGDSVVHAITLDWPGDTLTLTKVRPSPNAKISLLGDDESLPWTYDDEAGLRIAIPVRLQAVPDRPGEYAWVFRIPIR